MTKQTNIGMCGGSLLKRMKAGNEMLCKSLIFKNGEKEVVFQLYPSGERVGKRTATKVIESLLLKPNNDGLFGDETPQTWTAL